MKKVLSLALIVLAANTANAQVSVGDSLKKHYLNTYEQALKLSDLELAINSINNVVVELKGTQNLLYKDTLSMLYFSNKGYLQSFVLAQEVYKADPTNIHALARVGDCYQAEADFKNAAAAFETVAPALKSSYYYYQLAVCQYSLKKTDDCKANADKALADTNSNHIPVIFTLPNGSEQQVPVSAAALNLKGVVMMDAKNYDKAKEYMQAALKLYPEFQGAQQNLLACDKNLKGPKPTTKTKPKG